jgi:hypothetical protein
MRAIGYILGMALIVVLLATVIWLGLDYLPSLWTDGTPLMVKFGETILAAVFAAFLVGALMALREEERDSRDHGR